MRVMRALGLLAFATILASFMPTPSCADEWALPTTITYTSCGGHARLRVVPRDLEDQLSYFEDKSAHIEPAGQRRGGAPAAVGRLERRVGKAWQVVWEHPIANDVAPVSVIVRDDGAYAVTFDDWHGLGYGPHAVVIYGYGGKVVRALSLADLVPTDYIRAMPHSVSSIDWRGDPRFSKDGRQVLIPVVIPTHQYTDDPQTIDLAVNLSDGAVSPVDPAAWDVALATGRKVLAAQLAAEAAQKAAFLAPLLEPRINDERSWHDYLREGVARRFGDEVSTSTTVLRLPEAKDYAISERWVRDALTESYADNVALASLSQPNLVKVLEKVAASLPKNSLSRVTVYIALPDPYWTAAVAAMQRTGAKLVQLDPTKPIEQRPERILRRYGPKS